MRWAEIPGLLSVSVLVTSIRRCVYVGVAQTADVSELPLPKLFDIQGTSVLRRLGPVGVKISRQGSQPSTENSHLTRNKSLVSKASGLGTSCRRR